MEIPGFESVHIHRGNVLAHTAVIEAHVNGEPIYLAIITIMSENELTLKERIERDVLRCFEQSIGWPFRLKGGIKGVPLEDVVAGVDWELMQVCGQQYGNFHVSLCQLLPR